MKKIRNPKEDLTAAFLGLIDEYSSDEAKGLFDKFHNKTVLSDLIGTKENEKD